MSTDFDTIDSFSNGFADATEAASRFTLMVNARRRMPSTGIAYAADLVLTANHTVEKEEDVRITLPDGKSVAVSLAGRDQARDIALLRLPEAMLTPAEVESASPRVGQIVLALGRPDSAGIQASLGVISAIGGPVRTVHGGVIDRYLRSDAVPFPGFSGGPLISARGRLLGMNTSALAMETLVTIPAEGLWSSAAVLSEHGHMRRPYLGIRSQNVNLAATQQEALKRPQENALLLVGIEESSPAASAGLVVGDILVGINGQEINDHEALQIQLSKASIGNTIGADLLRGGNPVTVQVTLGER